MGASRRQPRRAVPRSLKKSVTLPELRNPINRMSPDQQSVVVEMSCVEVRRLMNDHLDGDLELDAYVRIDAHLDECDHCSALYNGVRNVVSLLGSGEVFPLSQEIEGRLLQQLIESLG